MIRRIRLIAGFVFLSVFTVPLFAQQATGVNVNALSDAQINQIAQGMSSHGLTVDQAMELARSKGATPVQISQLKQRLQGQKASGQATAGTKPVDVPDKAVISEEPLVFSQRPAIHAGDKAKKIFGFQLFNSEKITFEPSVNIPVPKNYILGVNDELTINVYGASLQEYHVTVDRNGAAPIPGLGPVQVYGLSMDEAGEKIKNRLRSIYGGMNGSSPSTFAEVSLTNMHAIKINVLGEVLAPGTYTLPATASVFNALYLSGGPNENGSFRNIRVIRNNKIIKIVDVYDYLLNSDMRGNLALRDQDIIYIPTYDIRVEVQGAFKRPGFYELKDNENITDMLRYVGGFRDDAFQASLSLVRLTDTQRKVQDIPDKLFRSFQPDNGDIYTADSLLKRIENRVCISGAVFRPGTYALTKGMKLSELIDKAQGVREDVYGQRGLIVRLTGDLSRETVPFDVSEVQKGQFDMVLQREDSVVIQDVSGMREKRFVRIYGEVQKSGEYDFNEKMSVSDLIFLAGGLKEAASESYIEISRRHNHEEATKERNDMVQLFRFNIDRNLGLQDSVGRFILKPYDYVYVRRAPSYFEQKTVSIDGEVLYPGQYSISSKDERISDLIRRAGGLKTHAYPQGATLLRKTNLQMQDTVLLNNLAVREDDKNKVARHLENGRVQLQLEKILENPGSSYDYHLNEGDRVMIPQVSEEVMVAGAIYNPIAMAYDRYKSVKYYIDRSGGFWDTANKKRVYVVYSDGTTKVTKGFLFFRKYPTVMPGSKIIVPQRQVKEKMEFTKFLAIASTFSTVAVAISAIVR